MVKFAQLPKYEAYKDSGVEWLGEIPCGWSLKPGFVAFSENKRSNKGMIENTVLSLSYGHIVIRPEEKLTGLVPESFETYQLVEPGDIIVRCMDLQNDKVSLRTGLSKSKGIITSAYLNLKVNNDFESRFIHYYLHSLDTTKVLYRFGSGLRQNLSFLDFKRLPVFSIPKNIQTIIADYLDQKTAQIDAAIAIKEQQIELLKERKQIIIQQAVTQGLDPNVPMKDSGIEWIGQIPEHWEIKALKFIAYMKSGETLSPDQFTETGFPAYGGNGLRGYTSTFTNDGDHILIGRQGALCGNVNYASGKFYASEHAIVVYPLNNEDTRWLGEAIRVADFNRLSQSAAQPGIAVNVIKNVLFPHPPLLEQAGISKHIVEAERNIHKSIEIFNLQIEKLKEYKTTLINSAVTGKIKVPGVV